VKAALVMLLIGGCGDDLEVVDRSFTFHATAGWYNVTTPDVVSVSIDGSSLASGEAIEIDRKFASYAEASATFQPMLVVVTTTTGALTSHLDLGYCASETNLACLDQPSGCPDPIILEDDHFYVYPSPFGGQLEFAADCGACQFEHGPAERWCD
jgi:hypothetical protein